MSEIFQILTQALGGRTGDLSQSIGADHSSTQNALAAALPLLLSGLAKNAAEPDGANQLLGALERDHDGSALDQLNLSGDDTVDGSKIVGHLFGNREKKAQGTVAKAGHIDPAAAAKLLAIAAPIVMAALGRMQREKSLDANGLAAYVDGEHQALSSAQPGMMGIAARLLDANHDGDLTDDLSGMVGKLFGR